MKTRRSKDRLDVLRSIVTGSLARRSRRLRAAATARWPGLICERLEHRCLLAGMPLLESDQVAPLETADDLPAAIAPQLANAADSRQAASTDRTSADDRVSDDILDDGDRDRDGGDDPVAVVDDKPDKAGEKPEKVDDKSKQVDESEKVGDVLQGDGPSSSALLVDTFTPELEPEGEGEPSPSPGAGGVPAPIPAPNPSQPSSGSGSFPSPVVTPSTPVSSGGNSGMEDDGAAGGLTGSGGSSSSGGTTSPGSVEGSGSSGSVSSSPGTGLSLGSDAQAPTASANAWQNSTRSDFNSLVDSASLTGNSKHASERSDAQSFNVDVKNPVESLALVTRTVARNHTTTLTATTGGRRSGLLSDLRAIIAGFGDEAHSADVAVRRNERERDASAADAQHGVDESSSADAIAAALAMSPTGDRELVEITADQRPAGSQHEARHGSSPIISSTGHRAMVAATVGLYREFDLAVEGAEPNNAAAIPATSQSGMAEVDWSAADWLPSSGPADVPLSSRSTDDASAGESAGAANAPLHQALLPISFLIVGGLLITSRHRFVQMHQ